MAKKSLGYFIKREIEDIELALRKLTVPLVMRVSDKKILKHMYALQKAICKHKRGFEAKVCKEKAKKEKAFVLQKIKEREGIEDFAERESLLKKGK